MGDRDGGLPQNEDISAIRGMRRKVPPRSRSEEIGFRRLKGSGSFEAVVEEGGAGEGGEKP